MDERKVLDSLLNRPGMSSDESLVEDMLYDSISELRGLLNYEDGEELPDGCIPAIKELTLIRFNRDGAEGISNESQSSGGSTTYTETLPLVVKQAIRRYRKFRR